MNIWDRFTQKEEYDDGLRDEYGRFRFYSSSNRDVFSPAVSQFLFDEGFRATYPDGKKFAACLTHDIDFLPFTKASRLKDTLYSGRAGLKRNLLNFIKYNFDRRFDVEFIVDLEEKVGAKSTFYFLSLDRSDLDFSYRVESIRKNLKFLDREGFEIGLHGGHDAFQDSKRIALEKERLEAVAGKRIVGYRGHFLKFATPDTWSNLVENQFTYDATLSYPDCAGFRNGMCYPFRPYSLKSGSYLDIVEVPLVVMDASLFGYMRLSPDVAFTLCVELIEKVEKIGGVFSLLWHNAYMKREYLEMFQKLLATLKEKNAWMTTSAELVEYWKQEGFLQRTEEILSLQKPGN